MELVNLTELGTQLLTVSAITKVVVDLLKLRLTKVKRSTEVKYVASILLPVAITAASGIGLFETDNQVLFYTGTVGAGLIAGLGSNFIHEIMKVLQTLKGLKK